MTTLLPTTASSGRPEPVLDAARLAAAVSGTVLAVGAGLVLAGWATSDQVQSWAVIAGGIVTAVGTLLAVAMPLITAVGARAQVTPLSAPVSVQGVPLITSAAPAVSPPPAPMEITDALRALDKAAPGADTAGPAPAAHASTEELPAVGSWRPATPAQVAYEPTPIGAEAEAATTGRITAGVPPVPAPLP